MKLEGWIAIEKRAEDEGNEPISWAADRCRDDLESLMEEYHWLDWEAPIRCTITIPHDGEVTK